MIYLNKKRTITYKLINVSVDTLNKDTWEKTTHTFKNVLVNNLTEAEIVDTLKSQFAERTKIKLNSYEVLNENFVIEFDSKSILENYSI